MKDKIKGVSTKTYLLIAHVYLFSQAMIQRLIEKDKEGRSGWNNPDFTSQDIAYEIAMRAGRLDQGDQEVDLGIANFALMNWVRRQYPELIFKELQNGKKNPKN